MKHERLSLLYCNTITSCILWYSFSTEIRETREEKFNCFSIYISSLAIIIIIFRSLNEEVKRGIKKVSYSFPYSFCVMLFLQPIVKTSYPLCRNLPKMCYVLCCGIWGWHLKLINIKYCQLLCNVLIKMKTNTIILF